eukprot:4129133-Lingulodinium_polyedra.AAC.1
MGGPKTPGARQRTEPEHAKAAWQMEPGLVLGLARAWGAALVVSVSPDSLASSQEWADTGATCVPASGD